VNKLILIVLAVSLLGNFYLWRSIQAEEARSQEVAAQADQVVTSAEEQISTAARARDEMQATLDQVGALASELRKGLAEIETLTGTRELASTDPTSETGSFVEGLVEGAGERAPSGETAGELVDALKDSAESAGSAAEDAAESAGDLLERATEGVADGLDDAREAVADATDAADAADAVVNPADAIDIPDTPEAVSDGPTAAEIAESAEAAKALGASEIVPQVEPSDDVGARGEGGARSRVDELLDVFGNSGESKAE